MQILFRDELTKGFFSGPVVGSEAPAWTLTTLLGVLIWEAEERFGPRDRDWTILGVEFYGAAPHTWFPGNRKHVAIRLAASAATNPRTAFYQLAHEVIHLLAPSLDVQRTPVLEEGLATLFQNDISKKYDLGMVPNNSKYEAAERAVKLLLEQDSDVIKRLRAQEPSFARLNPDQIRQVFPDIKKELAIMLCRPFSDV